MFIDSARFSVSSGKGGQGCASFRREKFVVQGGPDGGDGGKGGDVYFLVDSNTDTLSFYKGKRLFKADKGIHWLDHAGLLPLAVSKIGQVKTLPLTSI